MLLAKVKVSSSTWTEKPVVADVDNDGHADLVVVGDFGPIQSTASETGLHVFQDVANTWARTRRVWNQHSYHVTNVGEDASIPLVETPHWLVPALNNFRLNAFFPGADADGTDSFTYTAADQTLASNVATVRIAVRTPNGPPEITSAPVTAAAHGVIYVYAVHATDPEPGDVLTFSLPTAPAGMTIDAATGLIHWTPSVAQLGGHDVVVKVVDVRGLFDLQGFSVEVASPVAVPSVVGQAQAAAEAAIAGANLTLGQISTLRTALVPAGDVISQDPPAGVLVARGAADQPGRLARSAAVGHRAEHRRPDPDRRRGGASWQRDWRSAPLAARTTWWCLPASC